MKQLFDWLNQNDERKGWRIALIALLVLSAGLGLRDPWPPDEPALALMAQTMVESGEWLIPSLGGKPFAGHPPFAIWLQAAFYEATGSMRVSFLLPALLASLGTLWLVFDLARKLWGPRTGRLAAMALLCSFQFMVQAHRGHVDAVLMFWTTLALYSLLQYMLLEDTRKWLTLAGVAMGFGVLTKGLGYLPALIILPYAWMLRRQWPGLPTGRRLRAFGSVAGTALIVVLAWALPALGFVSGADDADLDVFRRELLVNLLGGADVFNPAEAQVWWYLPIQALVLWLPLSLMLPWKFKIWRNRLRVKDPLIGLLLAYLILGLSLFSLLPGKHGVQLLVLLPAMALLMAPYLGGVWWRPGVQRLSVACLWGFSLLVIGLGVVGHQPELWLSQFPRPADVPDLLWNFLLTLGVCGLLISFLLRGRSRALGLPVFFCVGWLMLGFWAYPSLNQVRTSRIIFAQVDEIVSEQAELGTWNWMPQLALFASHPLQPLSGPEQALHWSDARNNRWLLVDSEELQELQQAHGQRRWEVHQLALRHRILWSLARTLPADG